MTAKRDSALPREGLDQASRERITHILSLDPATLSVADQGFINAREDYLTADERKDFVNEVAEVEEEVEGDEYDAMTSPELKAELKSRGLTVGGKVDELRDRLRADDVDGEEVVEEVEEEEE